MLLSAVMLHAVDSQKNTDLSADQVSDNTIILYCSTQHMIEGIAISVFRATPFMCAQS